MHFKRSPFRFNYDCFSAIISGSRFLLPGRSAQPSKKGCTASAEILPRVRTKNGRLSSQCDCRRPAEMSQGSPPSLLSIHPEAALWLLSLPSLYSAPEWSSRKLFPSLQTLSLSLSLRRKLLVPKITHKGVEVEPHSLPQSCRSDSQTLTLSGIFVWVGEECNHRSAFSWSLYFSGRCSH